MKLNPYILSGITALQLLTGKVSAQPAHAQCGYTQHMQERWSKDPQARADHALLMERIRQQASVSQHMQKTTLTVPVVFHIIHQYGTENIRDAQVYDQLTILNADFRRQNSDISELVAGFDTLATDVNIEFRLPTIDPQGHCTNGIEHIYSHENRQGDDYSKLQPWDRSKYVNIWIVAQMGEGLSGYATAPSTDLSEMFRLTDGIVMLNMYTGSNGTSSPQTSRSLTHEMGHFLGLSHLWGNGEGPGTACGDDGIADTPVTKGFQFCPPNAAAASICNPNIAENYQNFMEFSFCTSMFTHDQGTLMRGLFDAQIPGRSDLPGEENLTATGALISPAPTCTPVADFSQLRQFICEGEPVTFKDISWNAAVSNRTWYFQDGTPATSTMADPSVTFSGLGWKSVKLVVSNATGTDSLVLTQAVHISQGWADYTGPYSEDFESGNTLSWLVDNPEDNYAHWQLSNTNGYDNSKCMKLNNYKDISAAPIGSDDYFYNFRLGGTQDMLTSPSSDLASTTGISLSFDYAYASNTDAPAQPEERLRVYLSRDCGKTWSVRATLDAADLVTAQVDPEAAFLPSSNAQWATWTIPLNLFATDTKTRFKFEFTASDFSNNLYLDNIRVTGVLGLDQNPLENMDLQVYPNPAGTAEDIHISYIANDKPVTLELADVQGKVLAREAIETLQETVNQPLQGTRGLSAGCYYVKISQGGFNVTKKIVVF